MKAKSLKFYLKFLFCLLYLGTYSAHTQSEVYTSGSLKEISTLFGSQVKEMYKGKILPSFNQWIDDRKILAFNIKREPLESFNLTCPKADKELIFNSDRTLTSDIGKISEYKLFSQNQISREIDFALAGLKVTWNYFLLTNRHDFSLLKSRIIWLKTKESLNNIRKEIFSSSFLINQSAYQTTSYAGVDQSHFDFFASIVFKPTPIDFALSYYFGLKDGKTAFNRKIKDKTIEDLPAFFASELFMDTGFSLIDVVGHAYTANEYNIILRQARQYLLPFYQPQKYVNTDIESSSGVALGTFNFKYKSSFVTNIGTSYFDLGSTHSRGLNSTANKFIENFKFNLRKVWVVEYSPKNPYSSILKDRVYYDLKTNLPIVKEVYGNSGEIIKVILYSWSVPKDSGCQPVLNLIASLSPDASLKGLIVVDDALFGEKS